MTRPSGWGARWKRFRQNWFPASRPTSSASDGGIVPGEDGGAVLSDNRGPWGSGGGGDEGGSGGGGGDGPRNPWGQPPRRRKPGRTGDVTSLDEFLKKSRDRFGRRFPPQDGRPYWLYGLIAFALLWILFTSVHRIGPQERGVVTFLGEYSRTMGPGMRFSWPAPIGR